MAYSCVKVLFEIGHEASIRNKRTPEGFTHDWEVFVRGADNSDIFHFVEKVVFHLHETFPKPKRVVKEPPYLVKESGYAGFTLPIDIYFKNSEEPKKISFNYDLHLQPNGPPISKVLREQCVFPNPAEDLRRRLIKGGGVGVLGSESGFHLASSEKLSSSVDDTHTHKHSSQSLVGKPKLSSSDPNKKHKVKDGKSDESRVSNSFHDLFGPPIKTAKVSPDPKKSSSHSSPKVSPVSKPLKPVDKSSNDKSEKSSKSSKHGSQKEGKESSNRSSSSSKEEKKDKEKHRDKDKNKDKSSKRPSTPVKPPSTPPKRQPTPPKRPPSPPKRPSSPSKLLAPPPPAKLASSPKHSSAPKPNKEEAKKSVGEEGKSKSESKSGENSKSEKKKKDKKNRDEKPKKDKHKEHEKGSDKLNKIEKNKESKEKDSSKKAEKEVVKDIEKTREKEKEKAKHGDGDKEKQRHKHKKKDKSNKDRDKERDRDKSSKKSVENKSINEIRDKDKNGLTNESTRGSTDTSSDFAALHKKQAASSPSPSPVRTTSSPLKPSPTPEKSVSNAPVKEKPKRLLTLSDDSSDSNSSASSVDDDVDPPINRIKSVKTSESGIVPVESKTCVPMLDPPRPNSRSEIIKPKSENSSQERNSLNKSSSKQKEKSSKKSKEREAGIGDGEKSEKNSKKSKRKRNSKVIDEGDCSQNNGETPAKVQKLEVESEELLPEPEQSEEKPSVDEIEVKEESEPDEPPPPLLPSATHLTEEYVSQLRDLQHKIMNLEDNAELQRVVQVIAETGQYEITKKTFDFDLCALDRSTVKRLQEFFAPS